MSNDTDSTFYRMIAAEYSPEAMRAAAERQLSRYVAESADQMVGEFARTSNGILPSTMFANADAYVAPPATNHHNATWNHDGNPNPFRAYPLPTQAYQGTDNDPFNEE